MATEHIVEQGEHLSRIATMYGFTDYRTLWNHPQNAAFKQNRQNPNVLKPGDRLHIPDKEVRAELRSTDETHRFKMKGSRLMLRLLFADMYGKSITQAQCELVVEGEKHQLMTDGKGQVEIAIVPTAETGLLMLKLAQPTSEAMAIHVKIGHLDPIEEVTGQKARLANLGYYDGVVDDKDDETFRMAVEEFQCEHDLTVDGVCGPATRAELRSVHGC